MMCDFGSGQRKRHMRKMHMNADPYIDWVRRGLEKPEKTQSGLARHLNLNSSAMNRLMSGKRDLKAKEIGAVAEYLEEPPPLVLNETSSIRFVKVSGTLQAGLWAEHLEWPLEDQYEIAVEDEPGLRPYRLYAGEIRGTSMNQIYAAGTVVVMTELVETREDLIPGKRYHVIREMADGTQEGTIKKLIIDQDGKYWLKAESDDPQWSGAIAMNGGEGDTVRIVGRVCYAVVRE